jgi:hypothetical protein
MLPRIEYRTYLGSVYCTHLLYFNMFRDIPVYNNTRLGYRVALWERNYLYCCVADTELPYYAIYSGWNPLRMRSCMFKRC